MNAWKVQWKAEGRKLSKSFDGDKPSDSGALAFAKQLKAQGINDVVLISKRHAFAPPVGQKPPAVGHLWCPYCVHWREFDNYAIRTNGIVGPLRYRCTVCTMSEEDYWVRRYNTGRIRHRELELEVKETIKRSASRRGNNISSVRRS